MANTYDNTLDRHRATAPTPNSVSRFGEAVTPSNTVNLTTYAKELYIGVSGDVKVTPVSATDDTTGAITFKAHPVGYLKMQVRRVWATGTTATNILALSE
jgi:hypothetical protein